MDRKDVTSKMKKKNNGLWRKLGLGLVGGVIGGLLTAGIFYDALGNGTSNTRTGGNKNSAWSTLVKNIKVKVNSDICSDIDKVQDAVVSVINLQSQNQSNDYGKLFRQQQQSTEDSDLEASSEGSGVIYKKEG